MAAFGFQRTEAITSPTAWKERDMSYDAAWKEQDMSYDEWEELYGKYSLWLPEKTFLEELRERVKNFELVY